MKDDWFSNEIKSMPHIHFPPSVHADFAYLQHHRGWHFGHDTTSTQWINNSAKF